MALEFHCFCSYRWYSVPRVNWPTPVVRMRLPIHQRPALFVGMLT
ncbi:hypothetical protein HNP98_003813 [Hymenobacter sp. 9A]|uniref:Uncharacterized protein n=1 Tax=Hymenobacter caeli TaxID=2735894 RepID=A0ABX2FUV4_9BACT|nr:hypothetical protein [Hymenobacter caeli]